jgi:predicted nucleic acid-binding protein
LHLAVALHSSCTRLASFDGRMQQAATALGIGSVQELGLETDQRGK